MTAAVGFFLGSNGAASIGPLLLTLLGTGLTAFGAAALNQWREAERDRRMTRTARRPLPTGRLSSRTALWFGLITGMLGPAVLAVGLNLLSAALAIMTLLIYVLLYTPMKTVTPSNTLIGAVVGALPPMIGWAAGSGGLGPGAWALAGILFVWQIPHFLALAWKQRTDYRRGGFLMLSTVDPAGRFTGIVIVIYTIALLTISQMPVVLGLAGWIYSLSAAALGICLLAFGVSFERSRSTPAAQRLFLATVAYLPLLMAALLIDHQPNIDYRAFPTTEWQLVEPPAEHAP